jgi:uncharacterized protein HemY
MRRGSGDIGKEGFRELITRNPRQVNALLAHGLTCLSSENYAEAKTFFEAACQIEPDSLLTNCILVFYMLIQALYYEIVNEETESVQFEALKSQEFSFIF